MSKIAVVAGTRPEVIKLAPIVKALRGDDRFKIVYLFSGQHPDLSGFVTRPEFDLPEDALEHYNPDLRSRSVRTGRKSNLSYLTSDLQENLYDGIKETEADTVVVLGDTATALNAALAARHLQKIVIHVEAGLRSGDELDPFPEELYRGLITKLSHYHLAPTAQAVRNLEMEGVSDSKIFLVGSPIAASFSEVRQFGKMGRFFFKEDTQDQWGFLTDENSYRVLVTAHRRENIASGIEEVCQAALSLAEMENTYIIWPRHPNPEVSNIVNARMKNAKRVKLTGSLKYSEMAWLLDHTDLVITDSAGVMEEASFVGLPTIVARSKTERTEITDALDTIRVTGAKAEAIVDAANVFRRQGRFRQVPDDHPLGNKGAIQEIVSAIAKAVSQEIFGTISRT